MINGVIYVIKQDPKLYNYLKYHSYWYDIIYYNEGKIKEMINEMKREYKETVEDKIIDFKNKIDYFNSIIELLS